MSDLTDLKNIGPAMAAMLERAGVHNADALKNEGSKSVFKRLKEMGEPGMWANKLIALDGAVRGIRKADMPEEITADLRAFAKSISKRKVNK